MKVAVVGAGGVGGCFGAALAKAGADATFLARGAHLAAMKKDGLKLQSTRGDIHLVPTQATNNPKDIGPVDFVLFCVKLWDVEATAEQIKPLIGPHTAVIPLQNGIDAPERLASILGQGAVMGGVAQISATIAGPGLIVQTGTFMRLIFGEMDGRLSARAEAFLTLCEAAGFDATISENIETELWLKFILLASNASVLGAARQPFGRLHGDPDISQLFTKAFQEVIAVGKASGVALPADALDRAVAFTQKAPPEMKPSMLLDLERGNRLELPWLGGKVVQLGRKLGVPTPTHAILYSLLKNYIEGKLG